MNQEKFCESKNISEIPKSIELNELISILSDAKIPLESWGKGKAKTIDHLMSEIENGEAKLIINELGKIERHINVATVIVTHTDKDGVIYSLREEKQIFKDGRVRERNFPTSVSEKFKENESPEEAGRRALSEELDIHQIEEFTQLAPCSNVEESQSYPGLSTYHNKYPFTAKIGVEEFSQNGYIEEQSDKTNYFVWDIVDGYNPPNLKR